MGIHQDGGAVNNNDDDIYYDDVNGNNNNNANGNGGSHVDNSHGDDTNINETETIIDQEMLVGDVAAANTIIGVNLLDIMVIDDINRDIICTCSVNIDARCGDDATNTTNDDNSQETFVSQETMMGNDATGNGDRDYNGRMITMETLHVNYEIFVYQEILVTDNNDGYVIYT